MPMSCFETMSFNLRNMHANDGENGWSSRVSAVCRTIQMANPHILGTQEGYMPQIEALQTALPGYVCVATGRDDGASEGETSALFVRSDSFEIVQSGTFWFSETPAIPGSHHWTHHLKRICTWASLLHIASNRQLLAACVHLDHESVLARSRSIDMLANLFAYTPGVSPCPAVLMGDFNMTPEDSDLKRLLATETGWTDSWIAIHGSDRNEKDGTFHDFTGRTDMGRIDYILTSPGLNAKNARIWSHKDPNTGRFPSDHYPISAEISFV
jgi:endonuclease/exonuclease/phosphatase family metal-dependent hydrolase